MKENDGSLGTLEGDHLYMLIALAPTMKSKSRAELLEAVDIEFDGAKRDMIAHLDTWLDGTSS